MMPVYVQYWWFIASISDIMMINCAISCFIRIASIVKRIFVQYFSFIGNVCNVVTIHFKTLTFHWNYFPFKENFLHHWHYINEIKRLVWYFANIQWALGVKCVIIINMNCFYPTFKDYSLYHFIIFASWIMFVQIAVMMFKGIIVVMFSNKKIAFVFCALCPQNLCNLSTFVVTDFWAIGMKLVFLFL